MAKRLHTEIERKNGWTRWVRPIMAKYMMGCCDCGLVHELQFYAVRRTKQWKDGRWRGDTLPRSTYRVMFRARRAPGWTARQRKAKRRGDIGSSA